MFHKALETERLVLRTLTPDDYLDAFQWCGDPLVNQFMIYPLYTNAEDVRKWLESLTPDDPNGYTYGVVLKETGELIGSAGMYFHPETDTWSFGYNLRRDMWSQGYATEATKAIVDYVCSEQDVKVIQTEHAVENPASGRIMEKLGLTFVGYGEYAKFDGSAVFKAKIYRKEF